MPVIDAGSSEEVCASETSFDLSTSTTTANGSNYSSLTWTTSGTGTFNNNTALTPIYTPSAADKTAGTVTLTLTANGNGSCDPVQDNMTLTITPVPVIDAGSSEEVCASETSFDLSTSTTTANGSNYSSPLWTTSGSGVFDNNTAHTPVYTMSTADKTAGSVVLTLTVKGNGSCDEVQDNMTLTINPLPEANNLSPVLCEDVVGSQQKSVDLTTYNASINSEGDQVLWFTDASRSNQITATTSFTVTNGQTLYIQVVDNTTGCLSESTADFNVNSRPIADPGTNLTYCEDQTVILSGFVSGGATSGTWFVDEGLGRVMLPSNTNVTTKEVTANYTIPAVSGNETYELILVTDDPVGPCSSEENSIDLNITKNAEVSVNTASFNVCEGDIINLAGTVEFVAGGTWYNGGTALPSSVSNNGDGTYSVTASYTPTTGEIGTTVTFTLQADDVDGTNAYSCAIVSAETDVTINEVITVSTEADKSQCGSTAIPITGTFGGSATTASWSISSGAGTISSVSISGNTINALYTPGSADIGTIVDLLLTASDNIGISTCGDQTDILSIQFYEEATVSAGSDGAVCELDDILLNGSYGGSATSIIWSSATGGTFDDANSVNAIYTLSNTDISNGYVELTITTNNPAGDCGPESDLVRYDINQAPSISINPLSPVYCEDEVINLTGSYGGSATDASWSIISGNGTLTPSPSSGGSAWASYTPSMSDIGNTVEIELTSIGVTGTGYCPSISETVSFTINEAPQIISIISDANQCVNAVITLNAELGGSATSGSWSQSGGNGAFSNAQIVSSIASIDYTPDASDASTSVVFTFTTNDADGSGPCTSVSANTTITFDPEVIANAGSDEEICDNELFDLSGSNIAPSVANSSNYIWASSGDGSFNDNSALTPVYTPGANDIANGSVTLTLTGVSPNTCSNDQDDMVLTIKPVPKIIPVSGFAVCPGESVPQTIFNADLGGGTFTWSATNAGILGLPSASGSGDLPAFTAANNNTGSAITSTVTVNYLLNGCTAASESFLITLNPQPVIDQIVDYSVCPGEVVNINFNANTTGETFNWANDNNGVGIGLTSTGSGDISFTTVDNNTSVPITSTFTYSATLNGCQSVQKTFTVTVKPQPVVVTNPDMEVCSFDNIVTNFTSDIAGTSFTWTNDNTSTGIPSSGNGNISTIAAENLTSTDQVSTITVIGTKDGCSSIADVFTITVKPKPQIVQLADILVCPGESVPAISFNDDSGGNSSFTWTASNSAGLGLPAGSGTGNIPSFTANTNNSTNEIVSVVTVTSNWNSCNSNPMTFRIRLKPTPILNSVGPLSYCPGDNINAVFSSSLSGTTYTWTNDNTATGVPASGTGNIVEVASNNNTGAPVVSSITVTPQKDGCIGPSETFTITVKPKPVIDPIAAPSSFCPGDEISIPLSSNVSGATISWTNSNTNIGLANSGNGNITFTAATNNTSSDITATIQVTASKDLCTSVTESFVLTLKNKPIVDVQSDIQVCANDVISPITFTNSNGGGTFFWEVQDNSIIADGTSDSGSGSFPGFQVIENLTGSSIETFVKYYSVQDGCVSDTLSFNITVLPRPVVTNPSAYEFCPNNPVDIDFLTNIAGTSNFTWTNDNTTIGLSNTSGSGNLPTFTAGNPSSTLDNVANITVTAISDDGSCSGPSKTITITVKPIPTLTNTFDDIVICSGEELQFTPTSNVPSTQFDWELTAANSNITGTMSTGTGSISQVLENTSGIDQIIEYTFTPINGGCEGTPRTLEITVRPVPEIDVLLVDNTITICSESTLAIPINVSNGVSNVNYSWNVTSNQSGATAGSGTTIGGNLVNTTLINNKTAIERDTVIYTFTPTANGCAGNPFSVTVYVNPIAEVDAGPNQTVCEDDDITLSVTLAKAASSGVWSGGNGVFSNANALTTIYTPTPSEIGSTINFTFTANDPDGAIGPCTPVSDQVNVTIVAKPDVLITEFPANNIICVRDEPFELEGFPAGGVFSGPGIVQDTDNLAYYFDPVVATVGGPYTVTYTFTNANNCVNSTTRTINVSNGPQAEFFITTLNPDEEKVTCEGDTRVRLQLAQDTQEGTFQSFDENGNSTSAIEVVSNQFYFNASLGVIGKNIITHTVFDPNLGCSTVFRDTITVAAKPEVDFTYQNTCENNGVIFTSDISFSDNALDEVVEINWFLDDQPINYIEGQVFNVNSPGIYDVRVEATTRLGCENYVSQTQQVQIGRLVQADFAVGSIVSGGITEFIDQSTFENDEAIAWNWDFGIDNITSDVSTEQNPTYNFPGQGSYTISLTVTSLLGCEQTVSKVINILPAITSFPYLADFEDDDENWFANPWVENDPSSWTYTNTDEAFITENNNTKFWKTINEGIAGFALEERSFLYTPSFDLSQIEKPMLSFELFLDVEENRSGAIVEYSIDGGNVWNVLGDLNDELNWYDAAPILNAPGANNTADVAWTNNKDWEIVSHILDPIGNQSNVRFRIAFSGSDRNEGLKGIAVDNFFVGARSRKVLVEYFTNLNESTSRTNGQFAFTDLLNKPIGQDIIGLEYHTSFPEPDSITRRNPEDPDNRAYYYGISSSSLMVVNGEILSLFEQDSLTQIQTIATRALEFPELTISVEPDNSTPQDIVAFTSTINPLTSSDSTILVNHYIIEKVVPTNSSKPLSNIVRKMIPSNTGEIVHGLTKDNPVVFSHSWPVNNIYTSNELAVVTVVQDFSSKEVLQVNMTDINEAKIPQSVTAINSTLNQEIKLYPNPVKNELYIEVLNPQRENLSFLLVNNEGKIFKEGIIKPFTQKSKIPVEQLSGGIYHLLIKNESGAFTKKKILIVH